MLIYFYALDLITSINIKHNFIHQNYPKNKLMEHSVRMPEIYGLCSHTVCRQNVGRYETKAMHSRILAYVTVYTS